jgi:hypothetical protein
MSQDETAVNTEVVAESTPTESAPVENKHEVADPLLDTLSTDDESPVVQKAETEGSETQDESSEVNPEESPAEETKAEEQPLGKADERKQQLNTEIRGLVEQRKELREEIEKLNSQVYAPQTAEELVEQGLSPDNARVTALEQKLELSEYNNKVVEAQLELSEQSQKVLTDFPMFNPDSPEFDADIAQEAAASLSASLIRDPNTGAIIGSHLSPYQIYKPIADAYKKSAIEGQIKGQKANKQMLASVDAPTSAAPREPKVDPLLAILSSDED